MRIAAIADIHGNDLALEAVLADIEAQAIATVVNLGDHLSGALNAARTADILIARNFASIRGNHDRWLIEKRPAEMGEWDRTARAQLAARHFEWLASLPETRVVADQLFLCHGTPHSDTTYWLDDIAPGGTMRISARERIEAFAAGIDFPVILCGHTHIARCVTLADGRLVVNPGSVGCPAYDDDEPVPHTVETGSPHARYAILEKGPGGWNVDFRLVAYDHMAMSQLAAERNMASYASALRSGWLAHAGEGSR